MQNPQGFLITGANSHLGRAFATLLSNDPASRLLLTSRSKFSSPLSLSSESVLSLPGLDLTLQHDVQSLQEKAQTFFQDGFHIINCLGGFPGYKSLTELSLAEATRVFNSNVIALYSVAQALIPTMCKRGGGHFIGFSTHTAYQHYPEMIAFTAAKTAVESIINGIANEFSGKNIVANTFALATLCTAAERELKPKGDHGNWLLAEDVCRAVKQVVDEPNRLINGNTIHLFRHSESFFHQSYFDRISGS